MILINCPYCGERDQSEFSNGGEAHVARPENSENLNDKDWGRYVFYRDNPKEFFMSVGFIRMDVENGLMLLEIHLLTKY